MNAGVLLLGAGVLVLLRRRGGRKPGRASMTLLPGVARGPRSVSQLLWRLARDSGVPVVITSWTRSFVGQARAMLDKVDRGENLHALYRDDAQITALLSAPRDAQAWAGILEAWSDSGRPLSRHLDGYGTDIRTRNLTGSQVRRLVSAARALGGNAVVESDHLHIGWPRR